MPFQTMSDNEVLGDSVAHFFKSGDVVRSDANRLVEKIEQYLPRRSHAKTKVEYDLWYDMGDKDRIHGYVYTDAAASLVLIRPASSHFNLRHMVEAMHHPITNIGLARTELLLQSMKDKYLLRPAKTQHDFVIFLPGTNIYNDCADEDKIKRAVNQGAVIKPHPITADGLLVRLRKTWGEDVVLDKKLSGHELLQSAKIVGSFQNSEIGLMATVLGKAIYMFDAPDQWRTYSGIYKAIQVERDGALKRLQSIMSAPYSGIIHCKDVDIEERIETFFNHFKQVVHVTPKDTSPVE